MGQGREFSLTGADLKRIAVISMLIDHIGAVLLTPRSLYTFCRMVGRLAFPLFSFLLVEGFVHTGNVRRYGRDLLLFAVVSEIPFDLVCHGTWFSMRTQNVFITLFLGLCLLICMKRAMSGGQAMMVIILLFCFCGAAWLLRCDYDAYGILLIALFYFCYLGRCSLVVPALWAAFLSLGYMAAAALSVALVSLYRGERGGLRYKYLYYWFYPAHLLILFLLSQLI